MSKLYPVILARLRHTCSSSRCESDQKLEPGHRLFVLPAAGAAASADGSTEDRPLADVLSGCSLLNLD